MGSCTDKTCFDELHKEMSKVCQHFEEKGYESFVLVCDGPGYFQIGSRKGSQFLDENNDIIKDFIQYCLDDKELLEKEDYQDMLEDSHGQSEEMNVRLEHDLEQNGSLQEVLPDQRKDDDSSEEVNDKDTQSIATPYDDVEIETGTKDDDDVKDIADENRETMYQETIQNVNIGGKSMNIITLQAVNVIAANMKPCVRVEDKGEQVQTQISNIKSKKDHTCEICGKTVNSSVRFKMHTQTHSSADSVESNNAVEGPVNCEICGNRFKKEIDLKKHKRIHQSDKAYICHICGKPFTLPEYLKRHLLHHVDDKEYRCDICDKMFSTYRQLIAHKRRHTTEKAHICEICGRTFTLPEYLANHWRAKHSGIKKHSCKVCNKSFQLPKQLLIHERIHSGESPFACDKCDKRFREEKTLRCHLRLHSDKTPFSCNVCGRRFKTQGHMRGHMITHASGHCECETCGKVFKDISLLRRHEKIHEREQTGQTYPCDICGKQLTSTDGLRKHMFLHTGEKPYACDLCGSKFSRRHHLVRHKLTHTKPAVKGKKHDNFEVFFIQQF